MTVSASAEGSVERGLNETRLAVLGIVVMIGLTVGIGFDATWWIGVLAGGGSFLFSCFAIRFRPARRQLNELHALAHRFIVGRATSRTPRKASGKESAVRGEQRCIRPSPQRRSLERSGSS